MDSILCKDIIVSLKETKASEESIKRVQEVFYRQYKTLRAEEKVNCLNRLLREGISIMYIAENIFGVDESTIRKDLTKEGYKRAWQFVL